MNNYTIREGFASYYVIKREKPGEYEEKILEGQKCEAVLPMTIRQVDQEAYYYYRTSGCMSLDQCFLRKKYTVEDYENLYEMIFQAVDELEEYLLPAEGILLESDALFYDEETKRICCCYDPGREKNLMEQLQQLTEEWLESMNYEDRPLVEYLYGVHGQLMKGILPGRTKAKKTKEEPKKEELDDFDLPDEILELDDNWEMPKHASMEAARSKKWYSEIGSAVAVTLVCTFLLGYQIIEIFQYGWQLQKGKYLLGALMLFIANLVYLYRKYRNNITEDDITMILTEDPSVDNMGEV